MPGSAKKRSFLTPDEIDLDNSPRKRGRAETGPNGIDRRRANRDRRRGSARSARSRGDRRQSYGRRQSDLPTSKLRALPGMLASAILGVLAALALSAQAETPEELSNSPAAPLVEVEAQPELSLADQVWLDRFENELSSLTPSALLVDAGLHEALLERSEALESLYSTDIGEAGDAQLSRIEGHLLRLGVWRAPVR